MQNLNELRDESYDDAVAHLERLGEEMRTLVIVPALLSSPERAKALAEELETLGCLEDDPMLTFVLLGDLPDAEDAVTPEDQPILDAAREAIAAAQRALAARGEAGHPEPDRTVA